MGGAVPAGALSAITSLHKAIEATLAAHSAQVQFNVSFSGPGQGTYRAIQLTGDEQFSAPIKAAFTLSVPTGSGTIQIPEIFSGTTYYIQVKGIWYYESAEQALATLGLSGSLSQSGNPTDALAFLYQRGAKVRRLGRGSLDHVTTTEYRAVVNLDKPFTGAPAGLTVSPAALNEYKSLTGTALISATVWVDGAGVVRQERIVLPLSQSGLTKLGVKDAPRGMDETMTFALSGFGVTVNATPPATSEPLPAASGSTGSPA